MFLAGSSSCVGALGALDALGALNHFCDIQRSRSHHIYTDQEAGQARYARIPTRVVRSVWPYL